MEKEKIKTAIVDHLVINLGIITEDEITNTMSLTDDLGLDSLDKTELLMAIERDCKVEFTQEDAEKIDVIGDIYDCLEKK